MKLAAESGEYPSLQSFLFTWKKDTQKRWIVLQSGVLSVYNTPEEQTANVGPRAAYPLAGCVCVDLWKTKALHSKCVSILMELTSGYNFGQKIIFKRGRGLWQCNNQPPLKHQTRSRLSEKRVLQREKPSWKLPTT